MESAGSRVSKRQFIARVAARCGVSIRTAADVYQALFSELTDAVGGGETVVLTGFGRFYRQEHKGHKVRFGQSAVDDYYVLKFSASRSINRRLDDDNLARFSTQTETQDSCALNIVSHAQSGATA